MYGSILLSLSRTQYLNICIFYMPRILWYAYAYVCVELWSGARDHSIACITIQLDGVCLSKCA